MTIKKIDDVLVVILLINLTVITFLQVLFRFVFQAPLDWSEEVSRFTFIFLVYLASTITIRDKVTIRIEFIDTFLQKRKWLAYIHDIFINGICALFLFFMAYLCISLVKNAFFVKQVSPALGLPMWILYFLQGSLFALSGIQYSIILISTLQKKSTKA